MSIPSTSRLPRKRRTKSNAALTVLPDVLLDNETPGELGEPGEVVAEVVSRATGKVKHPNPIKRNKLLAQNLHQEADELYFKGDYESALVLYHRAAKLNPTDRTHMMGAQRASGAITASIHPKKKLGQLLRESRTTGQMTALVCPEAAAKRAKAIVAQSSDPGQDIPKILQYFDTRKDFWRIPQPEPPPRVSSSQPPTQTKVMQRQLNRCVKSTVEELTGAYERGDSQAITRLSDELVSLVALTDEPNRNRIETYAFLATRHIIGGRHDKAVDCASKMFFLARTANDLVAMVKALVILGRVHINFGHMDALVRVWERLANEIKSEKEPYAWLLHDIGRCHLELGNYERALDSAQQCLEEARSINCKKWMIRGELLSGLALAKLERYDDSVIALRTAMGLTIDDDDEKPIFDYATEILEQVSRIAREADALESKIERTREELESIMTETELRWEGDSAQDMDAESRAEKLLAVFQTLEKHLEKSLMPSAPERPLTPSRPILTPPPILGLDQLENDADGEDDSLEDDKEPDRYCPREMDVAQLLDRARALRRDGEELPRSMIPRPTLLPKQQQQQKEEEEEEPVRPDSSLTHVIDKGPPSTPRLEDLDDDDILTQSDVSVPQSEVVVPMLKLRDDEDSVAGRRRTSPPPVEQEQQTDGREVTGKDGLASANSSFSLLDDYDDDDSLPEVIVGEDELEKPVDPKDFSEYLKNLEFGRFLDEHISEPED